MGDVKIFDDLLYDVICNNELNIGDIVVSRSERFRPSINRDYGVVKIIRNPDISSGDDIIEHLGYFKDKEMAVLFANALTEKEKKNE